MGIACVNVRICGNVRKLKLRLWDTERCCVIVHQLDDREQLDTKAKLEVNIALKRPQRHTIDSYGQIRNTLEQQQQ